jgi:hypothetical protein
MTPGFLFDVRHQRRTDAVASRHPMHQQFLDIGAVRLIGRRIQPKLDRADDPSVELCRQQDGIARGNRACDFSKESQRLMLRER